MKKYAETDAKAVLEHYYQLCHTPTFIQDDPVSIPHSFTRLQDREIMGLLAAILSWGQRITVINNCRKLSDAMDGEPFFFITGSSEKEWQRLDGFVHRTFNSTDLFGLMAFFRVYYREHLSLEDVFLSDIKDTDNHIGGGIQAFHDLVVSQSTTAGRTRKHIPAPSGKSTCKRINMFLRWMVRRDDAGIDFGLWQRILPAQLICPLDVHVERHARKLGLITRKATDWLTALELTERLRQFDPEDPVRYDFALFGMGILEKKGLLL